MFVWLKLFDACFAVMPTAEQDATSLRQRLLDVLFVICRLLAPRLASLVREVGPSLGLSSSGVVLQVDSACQIGSVGFVSVTMLLFACVSGYFLVLVPLGPRMGSPPRPSEHGFCCHCWRDRRRITTTRVWRARPLTPPRTHSSFEPLILRRKRRHVRVFRVGDCFAFCTDTVRAVTARWCAASPSAAVTTDPRGHEPLSGFGSPTTLRGVGFLFSHLREGRWEVAARVMVAASLRMKSCLFVCLSASHSKKAHLCFILSLLPL